MKVFQSQKTSANKIRECLLVTIDKEISRKLRGHRCLLSIGLNTEYLSLKITMNQTIFSSSSHDETKVPPSEFIHQNSLINKHKSSNDSISVFVKDFNKKKKSISKDEELFITLNQHRYTSIKRTKKQIMLDAMKEMRNISKLLKLIQPMPSFYHNTELVSYCSWDYETSTSSHEGDEAALNSKMNNDDECNSLLNRRNALTTLQFNIKSLNAESKNTGLTKYKHKCLMHINETLKPR